jgi:protein-S-isoprenylcysteine O-methyltransferase Ste14
MVRRNVIHTLIVGVALGLVVREHPPLLWSTIQIAGLVLFVTGFVLWAIARIQLGSSFSVRPQARQLVSRGVYSKIRNPIYIFGSCVVAGLILFYRHPMGLLVFGIIIPLQVWRARKEAAVLEAKFGEQYRAYRAGTWF